MNLSAHDQLPVADVGEWAEEKYDLVRYYANLFSKSMKGKWTRVYIDLFAGPGRAQIRGSDREVLTSASRALTIKDPFDKYIFCDIEPACVDALSKRASALYPRADADFICGDANDLVEEVLRRVPTRSDERFGVLCFCFLDPYRLANLRFDTLRTLAKVKSDFLVLIPDMMDAHRNREHYLRDDVTTLDDFLGTTRWRNDIASEPTTPFGAFVGKYFSTQLGGELGYKYGGMADTATIKNSKGVPIYRLGFFSKAKIAEKFWREAKKYTNSQLSLL